VRIAYVTLHWPRTQKSGVGKKIAGQLRAWAERGHDVQLFMHLPASAVSAELIPGKLFAFRAPEGGGGLGVEVERIRAAARLVQAAEDYRPDIIYLRYGIYVFPVHRLTSIAPTVEEINTNDLTQHDALGRVTSAYNRRTRGLLLRRVAGLVAVSHELAGDEAFVRYGKPTLVLANGIDLESVVPLPAPANQEPRLAFIGSPGNVWHGVDKLVDLARAHPDLAVEIIGYDSLPEFAPLPGNLKLNGFLDASQYRRVLAGCDVAVSSLALHRVGLDEASPLKSRECLALGLPLVSAYRDTDLDGLDCDALLRIPNQEDNIQKHGDRIRDFAYRMRGRRVERSLILPIDEHQKEARRLEFLSQIAGVSS